MSGHVQVGYERAREAVRARYAMRAHWGLVPRWWCIRATVSVAVSLPVLVPFELDKQRLLVLLFARTRLIEPMAGWGIWRHSRENTAGAQKDVVV